VKRRAIISSLGALLFSAGAAVGISRLAAKKNGTRASGAERLVSLTPAITETVLALGGGAQLVGVSNYCMLPPGLELPRLGSSLTPSFEAIAGLHPSLILCDDSAGAKRQELAAIAQCEALPWLTLPEVVSSIRRIGQLLGHAAAGEALAERLNSRLSRRPPPGAPRVLLLLSYDADRPAEIWFIRQNSLHGAALAAAGATNAVDHDVAGLPRLSVEELIRIDPDEVLIIPPPGATLELRRRLLWAFNALAPLRAVKAGKVGVLSTASQSVGPNILELCDALSRMLQKMAGPRPVSGFVE
jgi:ABC-type Fe3+-hydroxamate transport system substrate-binding protein